ncbi:hypothetical protein GCM10023145_35050 [Angustibacter luteus]
MRIRWRQAVALVPAVVLAASGIALAWSGPHGAHQLSLPPVPGAALAQPDRSGSVQPAGSGAADPGAAPGVAPGLDLPNGVSPGSAQLVRLDALGIPRPALAAYQLAARLVDQADPACHIDWPLVAAIGRVESNHARFGGNALDAQGIARPGIIGLPLNGSNGTARITDTDDGRWDRDTTYDRAVGPMQFIPGTWRIVGADADGDGARNPQDMNDAATATAIYLCSGPGDLRRDSDLYGAIKRYNNSDTYVRTVIAIADAYRHGVAELPAASLPAAHQGSGAGPDVEAAGARPAATTTTDRAAGSGSGAAPTAGSGSGGSGSGSTGGSAGPGSGHSGSGATLPTTAPGLPGVVGSVGSAASSGVSSAVSLVTSVVTQVVKLPTPIVTTTTPCIINVLGIKVCTITTISSTTTTKTTTSTHRP